MFYALVQKKDTLIMLLQFSFYCQMSNGYEYRSKGTKCRMYLREPQLTILSSYRYGIVDIVSVLLTVYSD